MGAKLNKIALKIILPTIMASFTSIIFSIIKIAIITFALVIN